MIRLIFLVLLIAAVAAAILHVSIWLTLAGVIAAIVALAWHQNQQEPNRPGYVTPSAMWKCPYCLKRTKLGSTACHHCGRTLIGE